MTMTPFPETLIGLAAHGTHSSSVTSVEHVRADRPVEQQILLQAGVTHLRQAAGYIPPSDGHAPKPAPPETDSMRCHPDAVRYLRLIMNGYFPGLLPEWLRLMQVYNRHLPPEDLPLLFSLREDDYLRIQPGERGTWLAQQRGHLHNAPDHLHRDLWWESGSLALRRRYVRHLRQTNPEQARTLIRNLWERRTSHSLQMRLQVLQAMITGLSPADEPLLRHLLTLETHATVLQTIIRLLCMLPDSTFYHRLTDALLPLLRVSASGTYLEFTRQEGTPEMIRFQVPGNPRAHVQFLPLWHAMALVQPDTWATHLGLSIDTLLTLMANSPASDKLLIAWSMACSLTGNVTSGDQIARRAGKQMMHSALRELVASLPAETQRDLAWYWLHEDSGPLDNSPARIIIETMQTPLDDALARLFIDRLALTFRQTVRPMLERTLRDMVTRVRLKIPPDLHDDLLSALYQNQRQDLSETEKALIDDIQQFYHFREGMYRALQQDAPD